MKDYTKLLTVPGGVPVLRVFIKVTDVFDKGVAGFAYADAADAIFYGMIYIDSLLLKKDSLWAGTVYTTDKTFTHNGFSYTSFTIHEPQKASLMDEMDAADANAEAGAKEKKILPQPTPPPAPAPEK